MISTDLHDGPTFFLSDPTGNVAGDVACHPMDLMVGGLPVGGPPAGGLPAVCPTWDAAERARLRRQNLYLEERADPAFEELVGRGAALSAVLAQVRQVAPTDASVLITGETGTGKELIARAIHAASPRRSKPMVKINCGAIPAGLVESELFGHERGAFTGAVARHVGRFESADGGTLFLDEVGELPAEAQVKLLRFLQERTIDRVGGAAAVRVNVRVVAATNRDLRKAAAAKTFRDDLYYRLNVFPIALPPLRERREDIPLLVRSLVEKFAGRLGKKIDGVSRPTLRRLIDYPWPGNIRELENVLERAIILCAGGTLEIPQIDPLLEGAEAAPGGSPAPESAEAPTAVSSVTPTRQPADLRTVERLHIAAILERTGWVVEGPRGAAVLLGLHPNTLRHRMRKLGITRQPAQRLAPRPNL